MGSSTNTLLIIGFIWPEPTTTAAGGRMLQLIEFFRTQNYDITFACTAASNEYSVDLRALDVTMENIRLNDSSFDGLIKELNPSIVLFDRFLTEEQFGWRVAEFAPDAIRILDTEDLHSLRQVREKLFKSNLEFTTSNWLQSDITKREVASIYRCDLSLIISSFEIDLLTEVIKIDERLLLHLPFQLDRIDNAHIARWPGFNDRKDFAYIGNGKHAPNVDAVKWLKEEIWPRIRTSLPMVNLHIYGSYLPEKIQQMHDVKAGFYIEGWVEDVAEIVGLHRLILAPLRFGAGIKGKLVDAMLCGTPSVTTRIGAEGMHGELPWNGSIEDSLEAFSVAAIDLYENESKWQSAQAKGTGIVNSLYDKKRLNKALVEMIDQIQSNLYYHRTHNFIGSLIMHQTTASTKYMSKWIEEKNK